MRSVIGEIQFLRDLDLYQHEKPYFLACPLDPSLEDLRTNLEYDSQRIPIYNARDLPTAPSLANAGFQLLRKPTRVSFGESTTKNEESVHSYLQEIVSLLEENFVQSKAFVFDYAIRKNKRTFEKPKELPAGSFKAPGKPLQNAHVDITREMGPERMKLYLSNDEMAQFANGKLRFRMVNAWRPMHHVVQDAPLAVCDYSSMSRQDLVPCDRVYAKYAGEIYQLKYNKDQRWYYFRDQHPDELLLFMTYDSHPGSEAECCAHASFPVPVSEGVLPRESIEVRALIMTVL